MYPASDRVEHEPWLNKLTEAAEQLALDAEARSVAAELFLLDVPATDRSKKAALAASLYAGALVSGDERSQGQVADAVGVSRVSVQQHWKQRLRAAGFSPPSW